MTAGESHGPRLVAIVEGIPAGLPLLASDIDEDLARRQRGYGRGGRMKIETDRVEFGGGVRDGETLGSPIAMTIVNRDHQNWLDRMSPGPLPARRPSRSRARDQATSTSPAASNTIARICATSSSARAPARRRPEPRSAPWPRSSSARSGIDVFAHVVAIGRVKAAGIGPACPPS